MIRSLLATAALGALLATPAFAQDAPPADEEGIEDIVVTAQRRAQSLQDVPIAISAFSAEQLEAQGVSNTLQLGQFVPNFTAQNNTGLGSANAYFLRGLGNTETIATFDPPVGTYVDDIYISRQNANNLSLFDVERVEVLRGPQGTLFGRNTTGGAINVIMRKPGNEVTGYAEFAGGSYRKKLARGSIDLPINDSLAIKISGYWQDDVGYAKNITTLSRTNDDDGWGARIAVRGDLSNTVRWNASYAHIVAKGENLFSYTCNPVRPADCNGRFVTTGLREEQPTPSPLPAGITGRKAGYGLGNDAASDLITSTLEFDVADETTLALITGYVHLNQQFALDFFDGGAGPSAAAPRPIIRGFARGGFSILNDGQHEQFSQEVKLNGAVGDGLVDYVAGFYYIHERNRTDFADVFSLSAPVGLLLADRLLRNTLSAYAGYAQADVNLGPVTVTAGIRYTDETKRFSIRDNRAICQVATLPGGCIDNTRLIATNGAVVPRKLSTSLWTPRFAVNFKPNDDISIFASATRGFKSGGWNARGLQITSAAGAFLGTEILPFGPEKVWSYEGGIKSDLFDRRVRVNLTAFYLDVTDLQTPSALVRPNGSIAFITRNFADYRNQGLEAELLFRPVAGLNLFANAGYQDDKYKIPANAPATDAFGIQSVAAQQAACRTARAANQIPGGANTAPAGTPPNNAPACAAGIVTANGSIATPVRTPKFTLAVGASYQAVLSDTLTLTPSINASYRSKQQVGTSNLSFFNAPVTGANGTFASNPFGNGDFITGSQSPSAWLVNAGLTLKSDPGVQLSLECTNCFNEEYIQSTLGNFAYLNQPRMWTVRAKYSF